MARPSEKTFDAVMSISMEPELAEKAKTYAKSLSLSASALVRLLLKKELETLGAYKGNGGPFVKKSRHNSIGGTPI